MVNDKLKKELIEILKPKFENIETLIDYLLNSGIIDESRCKKAVIKKYINDKIIENMKAGKRADVMLLIEQCAEDFDVSTGFVHNSIYKYKDLKL